MPDVIYNRRSFQLGNIPFIILSGAVHYIRVHPKRWDALFRTFRAAHLNTVETYVFWGAHEQTPNAAVNFPDGVPPRPLPADYIFSGRRDLFGFILAAQAAGLGVILRLGPYVCAEVSYGGFPGRLRDTAPGIRFRTYNKEFMDEVRSWLMFVASQLKARGLMAHDGGPVYAVQVENEYAMVGKKYGEEGAKYLEWCAQLHKDLELGVPGVMCLGAAEGVVETINSFYAHKEIDRHRERHPDQPPIWTECWTGWYTVWGTPRHRRDTRDLAYAVARFFAAGGAGINYYMWMGGTNFEREGMYLQASSYDYDAPIDEFYGETEKSRHLSRLHKVLLEKFAGPFLKQIDEEPAPTPIRDDLIVYDWGPVLFFCNDGDKKASIDIPIVRRQDSSPIALSLPARSVIILNADNGEILFDTATVNPCDTTKRSRRPASIRNEKITWKSSIEAVPITSDIALHASISKGARKCVYGDTPPEQLALTRDSSDYCFYTANFTLEPGCGSSIELEFEAADFVHVYINGRHAAATNCPPHEDRFDNEWRTHYGREPGFSQSVRIPRALLPADGTEFCITLLVASLGLVKGDWQLAKGSNMADEKKGLLSELSIPGRPDALKRTSQWAALPRLSGEVALARGDSPPGCAGGDGGVWHTATVFAKASNSWVLDLGCMGKGLLYVNGAKLGRYWTIKATQGKGGFLKDSPIEIDEFGEPTQRYYHVPRWKATEVDGWCELRFVMFDEFGMSPSDNVRLLEVVTDDATGNGKVDAAEVDSPSTS